MIDYQYFFEQLKNTKLAALAHALPPHISAGLDMQRHGDLAQWYEALAALPKLTPTLIDLKHGVTIGSEQDLNNAQQAQLESHLRTLIPWRKGPFNVFGIHIDTEWRSDWKWQRLLPHISPLNNRTILDVGCGNGYHCLRMLGEGAKRVVGIDPSPRFVVQFYMLKHFLGDVAADVLPVGIEHLPPALNAFDTTFSMGVLYHRRSPMEHLRELKDTLRPGGELVLETLVVDGPLGHVLVPEDRYAMMRNVWFIPSCLSLESWLRKIGFTDVRTVDVTTTSLDEQRATDWMPLHSLKEFMHPTDLNLTAEGHPAPKRAVMMAQKPV